jgi:hypothetical protein
MTFPFARPEKDYLTRYEVEKYLGLEDVFDGVDVRERKDGEPDYVAALIATGLFPPGIILARGARPVWHWMDVAAYAHLRMRLGPPAKDTDNNAG